MKRRLAICGYLTVSAIAFAYRPLNWTNRHANSDFQIADAVIIGRVTEIRRSYFIEARDEPTPHAFTYVASIAVGKVFRGDVKTNDVLNVRIGWYFQRDIDETQPTWIHQCNSQNGYDLRHNSVYLLALSKRKQESGEVYWEPRSGHKSIHAIEARYNNASGTNATGGGWRDLTPHKSIILPDGNSTNLDYFVKTYVLSTNSLYPDSDSTSTNDEDVIKIAL